MEANQTKDCIVGTLVEWNDYGTIYTGIICEIETKHHAGMDMDLTHVVVSWTDGERTRHTLESMQKNPRVKLLHNPKFSEAHVIHEPTLNRFRVATGFAGSITYDTVRYSSDEQTETARAEAESIAEAYNRVRAAANLGATL
jgi:hypothetical protein